MLLPARIADAPDADAPPDAVAGPSDGVSCRIIDILGQRAARLATAFAEAGWDIGFYGVAPAGCNVGEALRGSPRANALRAVGAQAGRVLRLTFLPFDAMAAHADAASALIADCAAPTAFGEAPRCLVLAPSIWPDVVGHETIGNSSVPVASGPSSDALRWDSDEINAFHQANVTAPLCLARAHHAAWHLVRERVSSESVEVLARYASEDVSIMVLLDAVGLQRHVDIGRIPYAASQVALHATIPSLARAFAPGMRVAALSAPLCDRDARAVADQASADAALAQALCYVAEANTITGATLQLSGAANQIAGSE
ncbi:hypothetical protein [Robbsia sp. KACC 23696]|uniref:hypothetical protein n=1 Tax=Robbsia sp. KACC 23696 TaxID=3149231 RepID=UPI00325B85D1